MAIDYPLTEKEKEFFMENGYLGPFERFLDERKLDVCRDFLLDVVENPQPHPLYQRFSVRDWHLLSPDVFELLTHPAVTQRLSRLMGENLVLWRSKIFYKKPGEKEIGWHQEWGAFNGEEIGNDKPSLVPAGAPEHWWDLTIWFALTDITPNNGPVQLVRGSNHCRYPVEMAPMPESGFWHDPFIGIDNLQTLIERTRDSELIVDVNTSGFFDGVDPWRFSLDEAKAFVLDKFYGLKAVVTLPFEAGPDEIVTMTMKKGQFIIFPERTMHGSLPNWSDKSRIAINCRVTTTDTLIYPQRLNGDFIDGSNIDITHHRNILLAGKDLCGRNAY